MVYGGAMRRTNIYLSEEQLRALRSLGERRGTSVAGLVREALDSWLEAQGVRVVTEEDWERRFAALLSRRQGAARRNGSSAEEVERDVARAVSEVRRTRAARRR